MFDSSHNSTTAARLLGNICDSSHGNTDISFSPRGGGSASLACSNLSVEDGNCELCDAGIT